MHFRSSSCVEFVKLCALYLCVKICFLAPHFCLPIFVICVTTYQIRPPPISVLVSRSVILPLPIFISTTRIKAPCAHQTITQSCEGITRRATDGPAERRYNGALHNVCCGCWLTDDTQPTRPADGLK